MFKAKAFRSSFFPLVTSAVLCTTLAGCVDSSLVTVRKTKLYVNRHDVDANGKDVDFGDSKSSAETAAIHFPGDTTSKWDFMFEPDFSVEKTSSVKNDDVIVGKFRVKKILVKLEVPFDMWIRKGAPQKAIDFQDGYVKICRRVYRDAAHIARKNALHLINQEIAGRGSNEEEARIDAERAAGNLMRENYREKIIEPAQRASEAYAKLTANGTNDMPIDDAIAAALQSN